MTELDVEVYPVRWPTLGRQKVHDPRSKNFPAIPRGAVIDRSKWKTTKVRVIDPRKNPDQCHGECTGCAKSQELNTVGNRVKGQVLDMDDAHKIYSLASSLDPFPGTWPPTDTGSSGLAACKAAEQLGYGGEYRHVFGGGDEVVEIIVVKKRVVNVGTWWTYNMFKPNAQGFIEPTGNRVGGHQYIARGYSKKLDAVLIRCWWGEFRDVWIKREHLNDLLMAGGDAHIQDRKV